MSQHDLGPGLVHIPGYLSRAEQESLRDELGASLAASPLFTPTMPRTSKPFSVRMTNFGSLGWVSDQKGYRYQPHHPVTEKPWAPIPELALKAWRELSDYAHEPEACLMNYYEKGAKMGLHQDRDEQDFEAPVVSLSLGDDALFRIGGMTRNSPTRSIRLQSGDAFVFGGPARLVFHGIDRLYTGTSRLLPNGGRINLTLRRVKKPEAV
jgi:DNA oxidative demethylase